jgi:hypothetical protein
MTEEAAGPADLTTKPFSQYDEAILKQAKL